MEKIFRIAIRLIFSVDCAVGVLVYLAATYLFQEPFTLKIFIFSMIMAHLPDFDLIPFLLLRKYMRVPSHWIVGHHPLLIIPIAIIIAIISGISFKISIVYIGTIAFIDVLLYFIHDSMQPQGLHWGSPVSWRRYTLKNGFPQKVPHRFWVRFVALARKNRREGSNTALNEIMGRIK